MSTDKKKPEETKRTEAPPLTMENRTQLLYHKTLVQVEHELDKKKASSQVLTQVMKNHSDMAKLEMELKLQKLRNDNLLIEQKIKSEEATRNQGSDIQEVKDALLRYQGPNHEAELEELRRTNKHSQF